MLTELRIQNFAIIQELILEFDQGLVIFTGETGAGKSIILDALEAVLGGRADTTNIRTGSDRAFVEAVIKLDEPAKSAIQEILGEEDLLDDTDFLVLRREIRREGRNTARINGRSVNVSLQHEVGSILVDIHGQSEHLSLLKVRNHLDLLDRFADTELFLDDYREVYTELRTVQRDLEHIRQLESDSARRVDILNYQIQEIEAANPQPGEEADLRQERTRLSNAENLSTLTQRALQLLDEGTPETSSITDMLGEAVQALAELGGIDSSTLALHDVAESSLSSLSDLTLELRAYSEKIEFNPHRLDQIEERIDLINTLKRKYGNSIEEILAFAGRAHRELGNIIHAEERLEELGQREVELMKAASEKASLLSEKRLKSAKSLAEAVEVELDDLRMASARFAVEMQVRADADGLLLPDGQRVAFDSRGFDQVEFLVEPNPGEGLKPLAKIASGGETSRLMLALKNVLAHADTIPILIFDEIDQGIGGRVGMTVGEKLWNLSHQHQVMCITHLPQLAAYGDQHYNVTKQVYEGRTLTQVEFLEGQTRQNELAQMLGPLSDGTLRSADEILEAVEVRKRTLLSEE